VEPYGGRIGEGAVGLVCAQVDVFCSFVYIHPVDVKLLSFMVSM